jgi:hypothetical protein
MRHGLGILRATIVAFAIAAACGSSADAYVYWTAIGPGAGNNGTTLGRADLDGTGVKNPLLTGAHGPWGLVLSPSHVYWANSQTNSIGRANLDGTGANPSFLQNVTSGGPATLPSQLATDGTYLYWTDGERYIGRGRLDGTGAVQPHFIDAGLNSFPHGIVVVGGTIYVTVFDEIDHVPTTGGTPTLLAGLPGGLTATAITAGSGYLYVSGVDLSQPAPDGEIVRVQLNGTGMTPGYVAGLGFPLGVAVDSEHIYWADNTAGSIGRATLGPTGVSDVRMSFISEPGGPGGVAVDSNLDPTTPTLKCSPTTVAAGKPTSCQITITDSASTSPPSGEVNFSADATTFFSGSSSSCTLVVPLGGGQPSCTIGVVPLNPGNTTIVAKYPGDAVHYSSQITFTICVGRGGPCKPPLTCLVPRLKGKTLKQARSALSRAHCALGKVKRPKQRRRLVVSRQSRRPGSKLPPGTKVSITLAPKRKR